MEPIPFKQLPIQLQNAVNSSDTNMAIATIATKFNLNEEKESEISYLTIHLLLGLLPRNELEYALSEALSVTPDISRDIAEELDIKVFAKVQTELDTLYKNRTFSKNISSSLPPPPPPPPGARRSIPISDMRTATPTVPTFTSNTPIPSYRPIQPAPQKIMQPTPPPVPPSIVLTSNPIKSNEMKGQKTIVDRSFHKVTSNNVPVVNVPPNLPIAPTPTVKISPFNTPGILAGSQKTPPVITPHTQKPINNAPISDILSAKLTGTTQATNNSGIFNSSSNQSRGYGGVDPYREPTE